MGIAPFDDFFEFDWETEFSYQSNHFYINNFDDHENFNFDFNLPHLDQNNFEVDHKPLNDVLPKLGHSNDKEKKGIAESGFVEDSAKTGNWFVNKEEKWENQEPLTLPSSSGTSSSQNEGVSAAESGFVEASTNTEIGFVSFVKKEDEGENQELPLPLPSSSTNIIRKRPSALQFDDIRKHFDVPMNLAAKKMNVCVTILKKRCRELKITRWPHRKLRSLTVLINSLKVYSSCCLTTPTLLSTSKLLTLSLFGLLLH